MCAGAPIGSLLAPAPLYPGVPRPEINALGLNLFNDRALCDARERGRATPAAASRYEARRGAAAGAALNPRRDARLASASRDPESRLGTYS
jgi:hypothetical protein